MMMIIATHFTNHSKMQKRRNTVENESIKQRIQELLYSGDESHRQWEFSAGTPNVCSSVLNEKSGFTSRHVDQSLLNYHRSSNKSRWFDHIYKQVHALHSCCGFVTRIDRSIGAVLWQSFVFTRMVWLLSLQYRSLLLKFSAWCSGLCSFQHESLNKLERRW